MLAVDTVGVREVRRKNTKVFRRNVDLMMKSRRDAVENLNEYGSLVARN
jgi:hypothetical protein